VAQSGVRLLTRPSRGHGHSRMFCGQPACCMHTTWPQRRARQDKPGAGTWTCANKGLCKCLYRLAARRSRMMALTLPYPERGSSGQHKRIIRHTQGAVSPYCTHGELKRLSNKSQASHLCIIWTRSLGIPLLLNQSNTSESLIHKEYEQSNTSESLIHKEYERHCLGNVL